MDTITSKRIRDLIADKGTTYRQISKSTGIPIATLSRYAQGKADKMPLSIVEKLASYFHVSPSYLMGWDEEEDTTANSTLSPERAEMKNKIDNMSDEDFDRFTQALRLIFPDKF